jgi:hypothetical protein
MTKINKAGVRIKVDPFDISSRADSSASEMSMNPAALNAALSGYVLGAIIANTPGGIERQEAEGQLRLIANAQLPIKVNSGPQVGGEKVYTDMGIHVVGIDPSDKIFFNVVLPEGWSKVPTDHSMWSDLRDQYGRKRGSIFFKAAFYDYEAFFNQECRFYVRVEPIDAYKSDITYEEREAMPKVGRVYDCDKVVFETDPVQLEAAATREARDATYWAKQDSDKKDLSKQCEEWLNSHGYTEYKDVNAYWSLEDATK